MQTVVITKGAHRRNVHLPHLSDEPRQFAHQWDADEAEDNAHQAHNFITYATALGGYAEPVVLLPPPETDDTTETARRATMLSDWSDIVGSALDMKVEIR
jgi:hypothetical protein